ncbi:hypothetical protein Acr_00g0042510 [Actinidia rufa]|uniref:CCHC-type domain-containing protein n=1 Tax=Actinidia rufa TaxID=165716 RepID=A0A7J0DIB5_9ERIC|nr:hypothetical protein Acr_00g0042510 [Actinidia rufa]
MNSYQRFRVAPYVLVFVEQLDVGRSSDCSTTIVAVAFSATTPPQPQKTRELDLSRGETQQGETSEYRGVTEDPVIPMESVAVVRQFLKLKPSTFKGGMDPVKANDWILVMEKNFRLLRCGEQQKVEIRSYLLAGEASRWWNLKGVREPGMDWARFKVIFREKFVPRAVQNAKCSEFEHLKQLGTTIADYEGSFTNLAEYAPHLVATDEMRARRFKDGMRSREKYFDSKRRQNFGGKGTSGQKKQKPEMKSRNFGNNPKGQVQVCQKCGRYHWGVCWKDRIEVRNEIRCFHCNEVGHIKRNCPRLRTEAVASRGGPRGGNVRSVGNARPGGNRPGNLGNRDGNVNNQRQGRAFALMPGDARNTEDVVAEQQYLHSEMEELEVEVVTPGLKGLCATMVAEPEILGEIRLRQMEDPKLKKIHENLATKPDSEFRMVDGVLMFQNKNVLA